ncbi:MAG TPA: PIN domain-containing protein [Halanaerobiales bacterium]|nr:PIN domain-containing protein [Halanaerobiales bacterium]
MLKKIMRIVLAIFGGVIGYEVVNLLGLSSEISHPFWENIKQWLTSTQFIGIIVGFLAGFFIISYLLEKLLQLIISIEHKLKELSWKKIIFGISGLIIGLLLGVVISLAFPVLREYKIGQYMQVLINLVFAYLGFSIFISKEKDISRILERRRSADIDDIYDDCVSNKVLDTSVIIDGRIADICKTGFIEGTLLIPEFILEELRHIADSSDVLKRNRGRRGLDILKQMQKDPNIIVEIINQDFEELQEVDSKLVKLAQLMDARIVTNDYNLNKVAELQGVSVLNINELANAVKPIVLPGEEMDVKVIKEGKEEGQGVAYLDDGTMIVVDEGVKYMNKKISVLVTSILQTAAGRMIFAKPKAREQII